VGTRVAPLVGPEVHVHYDRAHGFKRRLEVKLEKGRLAGATRRGEKQAVVRVTEHLLTPKGSHQFVRERLAGKVEHDYLGLRDIR
jgi:hypothetical protein